jgi:hypothetical protein
MAPNPVCGRVHELSTQVFFALVALDTAQRLFLDVLDQLLERWLGVVPAPTGLARLDFDHHFKGVAVAFEQCLSVGFAESRGQGNVGWLHLAVDASTHDVHLAAGSAEAIG